MTNEKLRLTAAIEEPRHRGMHLAVVSAAVADRLGVAERLVGARTAADAVHIRLTHPDTGRASYARLHLSPQAANGRLATHGYVLHNAGIAAGDSIEIALWDPATQALPARTLELTEVGAVLHETAGAGLAGQVRQRLADSAFTVTAGHRFTLPLRGRELTFEVTAAEPGSAPVRCTGQTGLTLRHSDGTELGATTPPAAQRAVFEGIGGLDAPIRHITELAVWPAEHPELFARLGINAARGILLYGPPGNGKTLLARAVAQRLGAHFFAVNGPEILSKFYGESEQRLRRVFEDAAREQPSVVFIDELDSIAPSRDRVSGDLEVRLVSQLLTLMDGLTDRGRIVVLGATNRPSAVDPALRRPGRFDHEVEIAPPDTGGRRAILDVHTGDMPLGGDMDLDLIAELTTGYTGADLASLCQEAALAAARRLLQSDAPGIGTGTVTVDHADFLDGIRHVQPSAFREQRQPDVPPWEELVGMPEAGRRLTELVAWPLTRRQHLRALGISPGGGVLLTGPASSGKTTAITALARHFGVTLVYLSGTELGVRTGETERVIRQAFVKARHASPSIVCLDNADTISHADSLTGGGALALIAAELELLSPLASVALVAACRDGGRLAEDPLFTDVVAIDTLSQPDTHTLLERRLAAHLSAETTLDETAARLAGLPVGTVLRFCDTALAHALWEDEEQAVVRPHHLRSALTRFGRTRPRNQEEG